ncbi:hypothetical protein BEP19_08815 [Ammoniphilus oxalaticus]|uniref:Flagella basal body P-ring formation protein FlgA SAF domain-containing protein n=1 Tax=Ammoniphilus oxalaticus TaxID=66863 RepID=A0A419SKN6_9BACL|nr:flagella basal body P-ring formation protein FlgA [Ammoniphilus oxalaticus]RKD24478.1 hypothetical protein BEP19_08815 [Ammoniphilus oxalaticus]
MLESKRRALIFIGLSILLAALAGLMFLQKVKALNEQLGETTTVYIAKGSIPSRGLIQPDKVTTMEMPNKFVTKSFITDPKELANKVSMVPLADGDVITKNMLKPVATVSDLNNRLVSLFTSDKVSFDQELEALDRVDVVVSHTFPGHPTSEIFMRDISVAMVAKSEGEFKGVALEVALNDAPRLIHMQNYADHIRILKSNVGNQESKTAPEAETPAAPPTQVEGEPAAPTPPADPPAPNPAPEG